ncbi:MAG: hypothetical protein M3440_11915 [Chloroflexota bacterium]|nr:hypothetical protein [Chloroflexota bacterium]
MANADVRWIQSPTIIGGNIRSRRERVRGALLTLCQSHGGRLEARSKSNAQWNDRTGQARGGIGNQVTASGDTIEITVYHTAAHGVFLELGTSRMPKLGVMDHEVLVTAAEVTTDAQRVVRGLFG